MAAYDRFLRARRVAERAIGLHIVESLEAGHCVRHLIDGERVKGTDRDPVSAVYFSGASRGRKAVAIDRLRTLGLA